MSNDDNSAGHGKRSLAMLGRATASAQAEEAEASLPRLLRYALTGGDGNEDARRVVVSEIATLVPELEQSAERWAHDAEEHTRDLANALDGLAVGRDQPALVSLADSVRLLGATDVERFAPEQRRVAAALRAIIKRSDRTLDEEMRVRGEAIALGWALVASGSSRPMKIWAQSAARYLADSHTYWIRDAVRAEVERQYKDAETGVNSLADDDETDSKTQDAYDPPEGFVRVCTLSESKIKQKKLKDIVVGHEHVLGCDVPLARVPNIVEIRAALKFEFPYALGVIDTILGDLVGKSYVYIKPTVIWGTPGSGKSHFLRRLAELAGAGVWRFDGSTSDGAIIGGTARRWYSAECAHPFLAISRNKVANPLFLLDELEKSGTRSDYGRLWDSLLGFLETETAARYPDPALQAEIDVSHVSYLATANSLEPLPGPLRDRMRILAFPEPRLEDLASLLPSVIDQLARERGLDGRWFEPLSQGDLEVVSSYWRGGSVRRLKRYVDAIMREREGRQMRN